VQPAEQLRAQPAAFASRNFMELSAGPQLSEMRLRRNRSKLQTPQPSRSRIIPKPSLIPVFDIALSAPTHVLPRFTSTQQRTTHCSPFLHSIIALQLQAVRLTKSGILENMASLAGTRGTETRGAGVAGKPGETSLTTVRRYPTKNPRSGEGSRQQSVGVWVSGRFKCSRLKL